MKKVLNLSLALSATLFLAAHAPAQKRTPRPTPTPTATPALAPTPAPQPTPTAEPFEGASVEALGAQCVKLETDAGTIELKLIPEVAPETVRNFLNLAATGFYDTTTFSRVVKNFVIQGGNISTRETITPELAARARRKIPDEPSPVKHVRGIVSMARPDTPNSATTNFFILVGTGSHLDGKFSAFGRVTRGMDVVDAINQAAVEGEKPLTPVRLASARVVPCAAGTPAPAQ
ncbi:MAG TPA: peptidylprolyl isomerase [Pyrinomonadaceae bacterium]|nr:peptidylprolyl isomerase [Pyrinomonadaceae bacterium]